MSEDARKDPNPQEESRDEPRREDKFTVLEAFGLKFEVSNPRLAELLTMDASEALKVDVRDLKDPTARRRAVEEAREGAPDVLVSPETARDEQNEEAIRQMRQEASRLGDALGFTTHIDGVWESPTGVVILTRVVERNLSYAAASHFVEKVADHREKAAGQDSTVLFIVSDQKCADVFKVAIRQARLYHLMRTITLDNLSSVAGLMASGVIDHNQAVILLAPVADIDVGEMISVIHSAWRRQEGTLDE